MQNKPIRPGYVPVTIELPAALAEKFRQQNYLTANFFCLIID